MKPPITYYGGKQNMLAHILPILPDHKIYTEAFFGGGAVFFAKEPAKSEIINDVDSQAMNFYMVARSEFNQLKKKIEATPFSRASYRVALSMYRMPHLFTKLQCAWAYYVVTNMGFTHRIGSWGFDKQGSRLKTFSNKKLVFDNSIADRLEQTTIECNDALKVISTYDTTDTLHYVDPPYVGSNQGHYGGYSQSDFKNLLEVLSQLKGRFILSSYPSLLLQQYVANKGWHQKRVEKTISASKAIQGGQRTKKKTEVLTTNFPI